MNKTIVMGGASALCFLLFAVPFLSLAATIPTFAPHIDTDVAGSPYWFATGDFNGDNKIDFAVAERLNNALVVALGDGAGNYSISDSHVVVLSQSVVVGNVSADSNLDLIVSNSSGELVVLLGNGDGTFTPSGTTYPDNGGDGDHLAIGDVNGDTELDVIVAHEQNTSLDVLLGDGLGGFSAPTSYALAANPGYVAVDTFNGDASLDLVIIANGQVGTLLNNGDGTFQSPVFIGTGAIGNFATGDFNHDTLTDVATGQSSGGVTVTLGNGDGTFSAPTTYAAQAGQNQVAVGDFDGDNNSDLAVTNSDSGSVSVLNGTGSGTFSAATHFAVGLFPFGILTGDINNDLKTDIITSNLFGGTMSVLLNTTIPSFLPHPTDKNQCKDGGYVNYSDENNVPFENQGQCVSYTNHH